MAVVFQGFGFFTMTWFAPGGRYAAPLSIEGSVNAVAACAAWHAAVTPR